MQPLANGFQIFNDVYERNYYLFMEIGLSINNNQYLIDQDTGQTLQFKDKYIKATVEPVPIYAGKTDILFEPERNYGLMEKLLGYYIDKESNSDEGDRIGYIANYTEYFPDKTKQRVVIKTARGDIATQFYHNLYLAYMEAIFLLSGSFNNLTLSNFDIVE